MIAVDLVGNWDQEEWTEWTKWTDMTSVQKVNCLFVHFVHFVHKVHWVHELDKDWQVPRRIISPTFRHEKWRRQPELNR